MARGQGENTSNKSHGHLTSTVISGPTTVSSGGIITPKAQENYFKSMVMKMIEYLKEKKKTPRTRREKHDQTDERIEKNPLN